MLTNEAKALIKYMPEAVNMLADRINGSLSYAVLYGKSKPVTNYDRLVSKTPEELAKFLHDMTLISQEIGLSVEWWEQWLKSLVGEVEDA